MASKLNLKENPTLRDIQEYVANLEKERGFDKNKDLSRSAILCEPTLSWLKNTQT